MEQKLLIQSYKFPPVHVVGAQRLFHFYHFLQTYFSEIHAITTDNQKRFIRDEALQVNTENVNIVATKDMRTWLLNKGKQSAFLDSTERNYVRSVKFAKLYHAFPFVYVTGDGGRTYIKQSYQRAVELIKAHDITHILTSFRPWADHIVAYRLKKRFPHLVWIADFRDLAIDPVRGGSWWPALQHRYQRKLLKRADIVSTVSDGLAKRLAKDAKKVVVVRNGLNKLPAQLMTAPLSSKFTITYTGSIYPSMQSTDLLFSVLRELLDHHEINPADLQLQYAGKDSDLWQHWVRAHSLAHFNEDHGLLSIKEATDLQKNSQINLLLSWSAENYGGIMTAKLADYLLAARPIIALLNGPEDEEMTRVVEHTGGGKVFASHNTEDKERLRTFIIDAYRTWQFSGALPWQLNVSELKQYTWQEQVRGLGL